MKRVTAVSAIALLATSGAALADVTPQQVWEDFETYMTDFGYSVTATEASSGDALVVTDIALGMTIPDEDASFTIAFGQITFTDRGDGTVSVALPASMPMTVTVDEGEDVNMVFDYTNTGFDMIVSGDASALSYDYSAEEVGLRLVSITVDGETIPANMGRFSMSVGPVEGRSEVVYGDAKTITQAMQLGDLSYDFAFSEGDEGGVFSGSAKALTVNGESVIPGAFDFNDMAAAVAAGFGGSGSFSHSGGTLDMEVTERSGTTTLQTSSTGGGLEVAFSEAGLTYGITATGQQIAMSTPDFPFPINASMAEALFRIVLPVTESDTPQDAAISMKFGGFEMADMLWGLFDPGAVLPRDPATVAIDVAAQVTPFISLLDAEKMAMLDSGEIMPGELNTMTLNDLQIEAAGGKITGTGAFTFDNTDLESFDGLPRPEGKVDLQVSGHNTLIDRLIQMGLLAEQDAMGARMMLGMFTVPGADQDSATSTIEINAQGHILANGQRIQ